METRKEYWPLLSFKEYEKDINPSPAYQRPEVWRIDQKQMLIDSILRNIDIPKIYLRRLKAGSFKYEIIDGQQRMRAIWDFLNNVFPLDDEAEEILIEGRLYEVSEKLYKELDVDVNKERIHKYTLNVIVIEDATEDETSDLFYRLNNGTPLSPAEARNSMPGNMKKTIKELSLHPFFTKVGFTNRRFAHDQVCAQMMILELNNGLSDTKDTFLSKMYSEYGKKQIPKHIVEKLREVLDALNKIFPEKSRLLNRTQTVNLYLLLSYLTRSTKLTKGFYDGFLSWYLQTEPSRLARTEYQLYMTSSANSRDSIEGRFRMLLLELYDSFKYLGIVELDPKRNFDEDQKIQLFARDKEICQNCSKRLTERAWHADHKVPWVKGGKTILDNGQVLCIKCNLQKKDKLW